MTSTITRLLAGTTGLALIFTPTLLAQAAPAYAETAGWATFDLDDQSSSRDYSGTLQIPGKAFPSASWTSDSQGPAGVQSGASTFLGPRTPPGEMFGTSRNQTYLNLRARTSNSSTSPSTTKYQFEEPTPPAGWAFILGDIDADSVTLSGTDAAGNPLDADDFGYTDSFNYANGDDQPTWDPDTLTLTGNDQAADTNGASAWFQPTTEVSSLTFSFSRRSGSPIYQTWFASLQRDVTGSVVGPEDSGSNVTVNLYDGTGTVIATTTTDGRGDYAFPGYAPHPDYLVGIEVPDGYQAVGETQVPADLSQSDQEINFALEEDSNADVNATASSSASADDDGNPAAETAAQASTDEDANATAAETADDNADAATAVASDQTTSSEASNDASSEANASATSSSSTTADSDETDATNADAAAGADSNPAAAASVATEADSASEASASTAAEATSDSEGAAGSGPEGSDVADGDEGNVSADTAATDTAGSSADTSVQSSATTNASVESNASVGSNGGDLPRTGADGALTLISLGGLLIVGGAVVIVGVRRSHRSR